jgi:hypothetical protein
MRVFSYLLKMFKVNCCNYSTNTIWYVLYVLYAVLIPTMYHVQILCRQTDRQALFTVQITSLNCHYVALHKSPGHVTSMNTFTKSPLRGASQITWSRDFVTWLPKMTATQRFTNHLATWSSDPILCSLVTLHWTILCSFAILTGHVTLPKRVL